MNFANALIQWGQVTGNTAVRDAGIFIYTTQAEAIAQYWFDVDGSTFPDGWEHSAVGMVWGDGGSYTTWFSPDPEKIQGINMLPVTGGHLYLGYHPEYVQRNYQEIVNRSGGAPREWQDIIWEFLATADPETALQNYRNNNTFTPEEGESKAHTFHWIRNLAALGQVDTSVTADHPLAMTFIKDGSRTYVATNVERPSITVTFSDGTVLTVPAGKTMTAGARQWSGGSTPTGSVTGSSSVTPTSGSPVTSVTPTHQSSSSPASWVTPTRSNSSLVSSSAESAGSSSPASGSSSPSPSPSGSSPSGSSPSGSSSDSPSSGSSSSGSPSSGATVRYLTSGGVLGLRANQAIAFPLNAADSATRDGTPYQPSVFTAEGLTSTYCGGATSFTVAVDSGSVVGNAVQLRVSYDLTGDGSWDRVETYRYFATDPVPGPENYTESIGLSSSKGDFGNLAGGSVRVEIWSALAGGATNPVVGTTSSVTLPFS
jgi:hypothetical protein